MQNNIKNLLSLSVYTYFRYPEKEKKDDEDVMRGYDNRHILLCLFYST